MPQADSKNTTRTRRSLRPKPDPIFAALAACRKADAAYWKAEQATTRLIEKLDAKAPKGNAEHNKVTSYHPKLWIGHAWPITCEADIERHLRSQLNTELSFLPPKTKQRVRRLKGEAAHEIRGMFRSLVRQHRKDRDRAGVTAAYAKLNAGNAQRYATRRKLLAIRPTTVAGVKALGDYLLSITWDWNDLHPEIVKALTANAVTLGTALERRRAV